MATSSDSPPEPSITVDPVLSREPVLVPQEHGSGGAPVAILGWSLFVVEAMRRSGRPWYLVAEPSWRNYAQANRVPFVPAEIGEFDALAARELALELQRLEVAFAVPLYEPTVEWAGAINALLQDDETIAEWSLLFRDKAMMKRRAQLHDIPVGVFRGADDRAEVVQFLEHVNQALLAHEGVNPVHVKAFDEAGCKGHYVIRSAEDVESVPEQAFPCLVESDLEGIEIACEVWIHQREIVFMNISEYVHLGHSVMMPPSPVLEARREEIRAANQRLIEAFDIDYGFIHPEWFLKEDGSIHFGEVAYRVPGGNAFELIERAYGFDPYLGQVLCMDRAADHEAVRAFFPDERRARGHAGALLVYPRGREVSGIDVPEGLVIDPAFESHDLVMPAAREVPPHDGFVTGTHWGNVYFFSDDPERIRRLCLKYENHDFYRGTSGR